MRDKIELLLEARNRMFRRFCETMNEPCSENCVHYYSGEVKDFDNQKILFYPSCKLW